MRNIDPSLIALLNEVRKTYEAIPTHHKVFGEHVLARVVACLVPGLTVAEGQVTNMGDHTWLAIKSNKDYIIELFPRFVYPGPILVDVDGFSNLGTYKYSPDRTEEISKNVGEKVAEIVDATVGARRFLGMP